MNDNWIEHDGNLYNLSKLTAVIPMNDDEIILSAVINYPCWEKDAICLRFPSNGDRENKVQEIKTKLLKAVQ